MWDVGDNLLAAMIFACLVGTDEKHSTRWFLLSVAFIVLAFIKDMKEHGFF